MHFGAITSQPASRENPGVILGTRRSRKDRKAELEYSQQSAQFTDLEVVRDKDNYDHYCHARLPAGRTLKEITSLQSQEGNSFTPFDKIKENMANWLKA